MATNCITVGDPESVGRRVVEQLIGSGRCPSVIYHAQTTSTNSLALHDLRSGPPPTSLLPRLYLADQQSAGRGRHGRSWLSNQGTLTFSLLVDWSLADHPSSRLLSLVVGVAIARVAEFSLAPLRTRLKWPNDVYVDGGKVAGVLIETCQPNRANGSTDPRGVVVGVGLNVNRAPELRHDGALGNAEVQPRSLGEASGRAVERYDLLEPLVTEILASLSQLPEREHEFLEEFRSRCLLTGKWVSYRSDRGTAEGVCLGVSDDGTLQIKSKQGRCQLRSGEATLLRIR